VNVGHSQGYYRKGAALEGAGRLDDALQAYKEAGELEPTNSEFTIKIKNISRQIRASKPKQTNDAGNGSATAGSNGQRAKQGTDGSAPAKKQNGTEGKTADKLRTEEDVAAAVADYKKDTANNKEVAYSDKRVYTWGRATLDDAMARYAERQGKMDPFAMLLPGKVGGGQGDDTSENFEVSIKQAFDSPDMLSNCVEFIRKYADDTGSHAAAVVVPRSAISYPQVWKGLGAKQWKHGSSDGFFVQLESRSDRRVWFVPTQTRQGAAIDAPTEYHALDAEVYRLVPALFR